MIELMMGLALATVLVLGIAALTDDSEQVRIAMAAKTDAEAEVNTALERLLQYFRTRMTARSDDGFAIGPCATPFPMASCFDIYRRRGAGTSGEQIERFRIKSACRPLNNKEKARLSSLKISQAAFAQSTASLCGIQCPAGQKPTIHVRHWRNADGPPSRDYEIPGGRFQTGAAVAGGFCAKKSGPSEIQLLLGVAYLRDEGGWRTKLVRKQAVLPTTSDNSKIEWLP